MLFLTKSIRLEENFKNGAIRMSEVSLSNWGYTKHIGQIFFHILHCSKKCIRLKCALLIPLLFSYSSLSILVTFSFMLRSYRKMNNSSSFWCWPIVGFTNIVTKFKRRSTFIILRQILGSIFSHFAYFWWKDSFTFSKISILKYVNSV